MNRFLLATANSHNLESCVARWQSPQLSRVDNKTASLRHSQHGAASGLAQEGEVALCFVGSLYKPTGDDSERVSLIDDPYEGARWLLARYHSAGSRFLDGVYGHYAVAVVNTETDTVLLANDTEGYRRLFYHQHPNGSLVAGTLLSDVARTTHGDAPIDRKWEDFLLAHEFFPTDETMFHGVRALPAGTVLVCSGGKISTEAIAKPSPWAKWLARMDLESTEENTVTSNLHEAFIRSMEDLSPHGQDVGVLLGGFDSALIASVLSQLGKRVHTFSFRYEDESYNQPFTEELERLYGTTHHWVPIDSTVIREGIEHYADVFNQPVCQPHYVIASARAARAAAEAGISHALTGDGCDGLFLGYPTVHLRAVLVQRLSRMAPVLTTMGRPFAHNAWLERKLGQPYRQARNVLRILQRPMPARGHIAACTFDAFSLRQLRTNAAPTPSRDTEEVLLDMAKGLENLDPIRLAYRGKGAVGLNKVKLEGSTALSGVTLNSPFLHPGFAQLARALPTEMSRPGRHTKARATGKYALMAMAERYKLLPAEIIYQQKRSPVTSPVDLWYMGELRSFMMQQFRQLPFAFDEAYAASLLAPKLAEKLFRSHVGISRYAFNAAGMLASYANFFSAAGASTARGSLP